MITVIADKKQFYAPDERKSKQWWAIDDFWNIKLVTGFECPPDPDHWWVPELGYTLTVGHHLFNTSRAARRMAMTKLKSNIRDLQSALHRLEAENV
jgi:hypothetical protein